MSEVKPGQANLNPDRGHDRERRDEDELSGWQVRSGGRRRRSSTRGSLRYGTRARVRRFKACSVAKPRVLINQRYYVTSRLVVCGKVAIGASGVVKVLKPTRGEASAARVTVVYTTDILVPHGVESVRQGSETRSPACPPRLPASQYRSDVPNVDDQMSVT